MCIVYRYTHAMIKQSDRWKVRAISLPKKQTWQPGSEGGLISAEKSSSNISAEAKAETKQR